MLGGSVMRTNCLTQKFAFQVFVEILYEYSNDSILLPDAFFECRCVKSMCLNHAQLFPLCFSH